MSKYHGQLYACISKKGVGWLKYDPVLTNNRNKTRQLSPNPPGPLPTLFFPFLDNKSPDEEKEQKSAEYWRLPGPSFNLHHTSHLGGAMAHGRGEMRRKSRKTSERRHGREGVRRRKNKNKSERHIRGASTWREARGKNRSE